MNENGALVEWYWQEELKCRRETSPSATVLFLQIPRGQVWNWTRASMSKRLSCGMTHKGSWIIIVIKSKNYIKQPHWPLHTCFGNYEILNLILRRSRTGTVWFYTSTSNKRAARPKLYTKSLTRDWNLCIVASHWWEFPLTFRHRAYSI